MEDKLRLHKLAVLAEEPSSVAQAICRAFGLSVAFEDPELAQHQMRNSIIPVGDAFLEVAAPLTRDGPAARFLAGSGAGGMVTIVQTDDLAVAELRIARTGVDIAHRIDKPEATELQLAHKDVGGCLLSIDAARPTDSWVLAGPRWRDHVRTRLVDGFAGVDIACGDPATIARRWGAVLGRQVHDPLDGRFRIALDEGSDVAFLQKDGDAPDRMVGIRLRANAPEAIGRAVQIGTLAIRVVG
ncbi:MAG: hypothetical protein JO303_06300 [Caulobacteraceae bacterium]|nr:hypothetical protein [Caulobacteraceae bacterium]